MNSEFSASDFVSLVNRYATVVLLVTAALLLTILTWSFVKPLASPLFLVAIVISAWQSGLRAGVFAAVLSGLLIEYFFILPEYQVTGNHEESFRLIFFALESLALCWLITSRKKAAEETKASREQLRALSLHQQTLREEERKRIALEIHDELGQALSSLKMGIHMLNKQAVEDDQPKSAAQTRERILDLMNLIDTTILAVRRIATELRPALLDDLGLIAAIEWQSKEFERRTGISCTLSANVESIEINSDFTTAVFRIFQETLTNILRHAEASSIMVDLTKSDRELILRVEDDGKGIESESLKGNKSLGILGMRERARLIGGEIRVFKGPEKGTVVMLTAPLA